VKRFFLKIFKKRDLEVSGINFNKGVIQCFFPHLVEHVYEGDLMECIKKLSQQKKQYDFINLTNVIEHVVDPSGALGCIKEILSNDGILRISVPNDFSKLQLDAVSRGCARDQYWVSIPVHLNYFSI
jgi:2-polyprenyl-3-methyl-5-hydroxy-6-metoxy-1,4-benzoquinol methylase